jgi:hypothetical protein
LFVFLKANNPFYSHIEIDSSALEVLPEDSNGGLDHLSPLQSDVEPNGINSGEISVCVIDGLNENCDSEIKAKRDTILQCLHNQKMLSRNSRIQALLRNACVHFSIWNGRPNMLICSL